MSAGSGAFEAWAQAHWVRLRAVARVVCGDVHLADDVLQDALIEVFCRWDRISGGSSPFGYASRVIVTKAADRHRSSWARRVTLVDDVRVLEQAPDSGHAEAVANSITVTRALSVLNVHQRAAVALHYFADYSIAEISETLQRPIGSVTSDLTRARAALREHLGTKGGDEDA
jgi:RNA polymerase sigma factor (sigma-70 family)